MTREEAIEILKSKMDGSVDTSYEWAEAVRMAIEALKAPTGFISKRDAIDALGEEPPVWYDGEDEIAERNQWRRDKAAIESLPSATCDDCIWHTCNYNKVDWDGEDGYISRRDAIKNAHFPMIDDAGYEIVRVDDILWLPSVEPKREECEEREQGLCPFYAG